MIMMIMMMMMTTGCCGNNCKRPSDNVARSVSWAQMTMTDDDADIDDDIDTMDRDTTSLVAEGVPVEPFDMKTEQSDGTGYFEGDTYIFRRQPKNRRADDEEPDAWLESLDDSSFGNDHDLHHTSAPTSAVAATSKSASSSSRGGIIDGLPPQDLYALIVPLMSDASETVLQAIVRYGNLIPRKRTPKKTANNKNIDDKEAVATHRAQTSLNRLTEASNALLLQGHVDIYQATKTKLLKLLSPPPAAAAAPENSNTEAPTTTTRDDQKNKPAVADVQWEYQGSQDQQVHGRYSTSDMLAWINAGYFVGSAAVLVRTIQSTAHHHNNNSQKETSSIQKDLLADLMDDDDEDNGGGGDADDTTSRDAAVVKGEWMLSDKVDFTKYR